MFPEVLSKEELNDLDLMIQPIDRYFSEQCEFFYPQMSVIAGL